jgi:hypothetical protein
VQLSGNVGAVLKWNYYYLETFFIDRNMNDTDTVNEYNLERLTHSQANQRIEERPAIIVPLGGCEPFGDEEALGAESARVSEIAGELSKRCGVLVAPLVPFACSAPFMAFAGAVGVKPRTFVNMLCEILHGYIFQGANRFFLINAAMFNMEPIDETARRLENKYPQVRVVSYNINAADSRHNAVHYRTWKRRGRDPQKLRSLFPDGLLSPSDIGVTPECLDRMAESIRKEIEVG